MFRSIYAQTTQCHNCTCKDLLYLGIFSSSDERRFWSNRIIPFPLFTVMYQCWNCTTLNSMPQKLLEKVDASSITEEG